MPPENEEEGEPEGSPEEAKGWTAIAELTAGLPPEQIEALISVRELESAYPLLHGLVGKNLRDFFVRAGALEAIVASGRVPATREDMAEILYWLPDESRQNVVRALRENGWLELDGSHGDYLTDAGLWAHEILGYLKQKVQTQDLVPTVQGMEYARRLGMDPIRQLYIVRAKLTALREEIEVARLSHSPVILRRAAEKLQATLSLSRQIREILDSLDQTRPNVHRVVNDIHDLLSRLHSATAELQGDISEVGRQYLRITGGLRTDQIVQAMMRLTRQELTEVGRVVVLPVVARRPLLTLEPFCQAAEVSVTRERKGSDEVEWTPPEPAERGTSSIELTTEVLAFLQDLETIAASDSPSRLPAFVPRNAKAESFLRASLLPLVGDGRSGSGVAGRLADMPLELHVENALEKLQTEPLTRVSKGELRAKRGKKHG